MIPIHMADRASHFAESSLSAVGMSVGSLLAIIGAADPDTAVRWGLALIGIGIAVANGIFAYQHKRQNDRREALIADALTQGRLRTLAQMERENGEDMTAGKPPRWVILLPGYDDDATEPPSKSDVAK